MYVRVCEYIYATCAVLILFCLVYAGILGKCCILIGLYETTWFDISVGAIHIFNWKFHMT